MHEKRRGLTIGRPDIFLPQEQAHGAFVRPVLVARDGIAHHPVQDFKQIVGLRDLPLISFSNHDTAL